MMLVKLCRGLTLRSLLCSIVLIGATALITTQVMSQDYGSKKDSKHQGGMSDVDMKKWMELNQPGPHHMKLDIFAGTWNVQSKCWMDPSAPPDEGTGKATFTWILDRHHLQQTYEASSKMGPFKGVGIMGYDNAKKEYWQVWLDSMSTAPMMNEGSSDPAGRTFTFKAEGDCPMTGKLMKYRSVMKVESPSKFVFEMYQSDGGPEQKAMEILYTKA